jgi:hypothetical protein
VAGLLILACQARADEWTPEDSIRESIFVGALIADGLTTVHLLESKKGTETNPLLGKYPTNKKLIAFGSAVVVGHLGVSLALPKDWRLAWQHGSIAIELLCITNNSLIIKGVIK